MKKTVLITGSSTGIGRYAALEFAKHQWNVVIQGFTHQEELDSLHQEILSYGVQCESFCGDLCSPEFIDHMVSSAQSTFGSIDCLVNNAGISKVGLFSDATLDDWNEILSTNVTSAFLMSQQVLPSMIQHKRGKILNISSIWGDAGASLEVLYSTTKGAINAMTKALAKEVAPSHIQVNAIAFGMIDTAMNACYSEAERADIAAEIPADYIASPEEAAQMIYHTACSPSYMTGQVITFSGGWY